MPVDFAPPCHVLLVEDDLALRLALLDILEFAGFEVATAGDGVEALQSIRDSGAPCVMLLDLMMPRMDGREVLDRLATDSTLPKVTTAVLTASTDLADIPAGTTILRKPIALEELVNFVATYCPAR